MTRKESEGEEDGEGSMEVGEEERGWSASAALVLA